MLLAPSLTRPAKLNWTRVLDHFPSNFRLPFSFLRFSLHLPFVFFVFPLSSFFFYLFLTLFLSFLLCLTLFYFTFFFYIYFFTFFGECRGFCKLTEQYLSLAKEEHLSYNEQVLFLNERCLFFYNEQYIIIARGAFFVLLLWVIYLSDDEDVFSWRYFMNIVFRCASRVAIFSLLGNRMAHKGFALCARQYFTRLYCLFILFFISMRTCVNIISFRTTKQSLTIYMPSVRQHCALSRLEKKKKSNKKYSSSFSSIIMEN